MTDAAVIEGQLVDVRNSGLHKDVALKIMVPAEYAKRVLDTFGWPTQVNPVAVFIVGRTTEAELIQGLAPYLPPSAQQKAQSPELVEPAPMPPARARRPVAPDKRLAQQAGMICADPLFAAFLHEHGMLNVKGETDLETAAATAVRLICGVKSRSGIVPDTPAGRAWDELMGSFEMWKRAA